MEKALPSQLCSTIDRICMLMIRWIKNDRSSYAVWWIKHDVIYVYYVHQQDMEFQTLAWNKCLSIVDICHKTCRTSARTSSQLSLAPPPHLFQSIGFFFLFFTGRPTRRNTSRKQKYWIGKIRKIKCWQIGIAQEGKLPRWCVMWWGVLVGTRVWLWKTSPYFSIHGWFHSWPGETYACNENLFDCSWEW